MTINNSNIFDYTQLAEASYSNFWDKDGKFMTDILEIKKALIRNGIGNKSLVDTPNDPSHVQADELLKDWSVLAQYKDRTDESSFSATLFKNNGTDGEYVFACKGTLGMTDILTDAGDLVHDGLAMYQIVDMYNFWQQINAPKGASYKVRVLEEVDLLEADSASIGSLQAQGYVIDSNLGAAASGYKRVMRFVEKDSSAIYTKDDERATGLGIDREKVKVTVVGHSLGGHLASAFSRLFPELVDDCLMINGAGYGDFGTSGIGRGNIPLRPTFLSCFSH